MTMKQRASPGNNESNLQRMHDQHLVQPPVCVSPQGNTWSHTRHGTRRAITWSNWWCITTSQCQYP